MTYSQKLRKLFPEISLTWEDLLLLETFQIKYLPDRVPVKEFATLIRSYPVLHGFLISKYPPIAPFLSGILEKDVPTEKKEPVENQCQEALWEIADLIIYNKHPERFDAQAPIRWEISEISSLSSLEGKVGMLSDKGIDNRDNLIIMGDDFLSARGYGICRHVAIRIENEFADRPIR